MTDDEVLAEFRAADALLEGHFILSSGLRSSRYLQCARVLMDPRRGARLARRWSRRMPAEMRASIQAVVSPAMGGVIAGHEMARALGVEAMFLERPDGHVRAAPRLPAGAGHAGADDGGRRHHRASARARRSPRSSRRAATTVAAAALVDRSNGTADLGVPFFPLIRLDVPTYAADALPPELAAIPAIKPGSRAA